MVMKADSSPLFLSPATLSLSDSGVFPNANVEHPNLDYIEYLISSDASIEDSNSAESDSFIIPGDDALMTRGPEGSLYSDAVDSTGDTDKYLDPIHQYQRAFPYGHMIVPTSSTGLLCGFAAVIKSLQVMHQYMPCPTITDLQTILRSPWFREYNTAFGMSNDNNFSIDQIAAVVYAWGYNMGYNVRIGVVPEGERPMLVPHPNDWSAITVWVHNDGLSNDEGRLGHYSGMRPNEIEEIE